MSVVDELKAAVGNGPYGYYPKVPLATAIAIVERLEFQRFALAQADKMGDDRIKELEQQVATLTAENTELREKITGNGQDAYDIYEDQRERIASLTAALEKARKALIASTDKLNDWIDRDECDCTMDGGVHSCALPDLQRVIEDNRTALAALGEPREV
jgi:hypothetical protein